MKGDRGLTPHGVRQVEHLHYRLSSTKEIEANVLISSDLPRAMQTAELISPLWGCPVIQNSGFQEMHVGESDGMDARDAEVKYGKCDLYENPYSRVAPGAENWGEFVLRVGESLQETLKLYQGKNIVLVTHAGVIDAVMMIFFKLHTLAMPPVGSHLFNTSITHWYQENPDALPAWRLMGYNDHAHL